MPVTPAGSTNPFVQIYQSYKMTAVRAVPSLARWGFVAGFFVVWAVEPAAIYKRIPVVRKRFGYNQDKVCHVRVL